MPSTTIIAEAGVNHNGSLDLALQLVDAAADCGADIVKFQTFDAKALATAGAARAKYQAENIGEDGSQLTMLEALSLDEAAHHAVAAHCQQRGIAFMSTAFDFQSFAFLRQFSMPFIKIPSGDLTFGPMLLAAGASGSKVILSTGMGNMDEIGDALAVLVHGRRFGADGGAPLDEMRARFAEPEALAVAQGFITVLHCVTQYPCPPAFANLAAMDSIAAKFALPVGYSDHSLGIAVPIAAVARGAMMIEKHITLDRALPGPDHVASLEPDQFAAMVAGIREVQMAIGDGVKQANEAERDNIAVARRSLVAARDIAAGSPLTPADIIAKRPGTGLSPMLYWDLLGQAAPRDFALDELLDR
jgi:N-acetylneuraminate synthase